MAFIDEIKERAKADKKTIVLPESMDKRTFEAAEKILKDQFDLKAFHTFLLDIGPAQFSIIQPYFRLWLAEQMD